ncbi:MAG: hypothetical protein CSA47_02115 [Gammaproteobacteria bacterium]|nr:MAG: hypothetical protein CSA47_02115 [Gammaproteobacteria bacterium]
MRIFKLILGITVCWGVVILFFMSLLATMVVVAVARLVTRVLAKLNITAAWKHAATRCRRDSSARNTGTVIEGQCTVIDG